jgi:hypothetical protein
VDAAGRQRAADVHELIARVGADDGDDAGVDKSAKRCESISHR